MTSKKRKYKQEMNLAASKRESELLPAEGLITVSFVFGGIRHVERHRLNEFELRQMKELIQQHGGLASQQVVWRGAIKCAEQVAKNCVAEAGQRFDEEFGPKVKVADAVEVEEAAIPNVFSAAGLGMNAAQEALQVTEKLDVLEVKENQDGN